MKQVRVLLLLHSTYMAFGSQGPSEVLRHQDFGLSIGIMAALILFLVGLAVFVYWPTRTTSRLTLTVQHQISLTDELD